MSHALSRTEHPVNQIMEIHDNCLLGILYKLCTFLCFNINNNIIMGLHNLINTFWSSIMLGYGKGFRSQYVNFETILSVTLRDTTTVQLWEHTNYPCLLKETAMFFLIC